MKRKIVNIMQAVLLTVPLILLTSCASVTATKVTDDHTEGIRYYRPAPYLLVSDSFANVSSATKKGEFENNKYAVSIIYLPDISQEYAIKASGGLGTANLKLTLQDGWNLVSTEQSVDSKTSEIITAFGGILGSATNLPKSFVPSEKDNIPGIYKFEFGKDGKISGVKQVVRFSDLGNP
ncbi:MAG: hypothetical protein ACYDFU_08095 [Nitrospirota bacterium]